MVTVDDQGVHRDLALALREFWTEYTGVCPRRVHVIVGDGAIAVRLEEVLSLAEKQMAATQAGRAVLLQLEERILEQAKPKLRELIESTVWQEGVQVEIFLDAEKGSIVGFFWRQEKETLGHANRTEL